MGGALDQNKLTKVTLQTFVAWKNKEKVVAEKKEKDKKKKDFKESGGGGMSGRDMFLMDPGMMERHVEDPDDDEDEFDLNIREGHVDDGVKVHEIKFDEYGIMDDGVDDSTAVQLARAMAEDGGAGAAAALDVDEDLFYDDLDDLEDELYGLEM